MVGGGGEDVGCQDLLGRVCDWVRLVGRLNIFKLFFTKLENQILILLLPAGEILQNCYFSGLFLLG